MVSGNFYQAPSSFDSPDETCDDLSSFPLLDATLAADNEIILNTLLATMPAITVELPAMLKPPEDFVSLQSLSSKDNRWGFIFQKHYLQNGFWDVCGGSVTGLLRDIESLVILLIVILLVKHYP